MQTKWNTIKPESDKSESKSSQLLLDAPHSKIKWFLTTNKRSLLGVAATTFVVTLTIAWFNFSNFSFQANSLFWSTWSSLTSTWEVTSTWENVFDTGSIAGSALSDNFNDEAFDVSLWEETLWSDSWDSNNSWNDTNDTSNFDALFDVPSDDQLLDSWSDIADGLISDTSNNDNVSSGSWSELIDSTVSQNEDEWTFVFRENTHKVDSYILANAEQINKEKFAMNDSTFNEDVLNEDFHSAANDLNNQEQTQVDSSSNEDDWEVYWVLYNNEFNSKAKYYMITDWWAKLYFDTKRNLAWALWKRIILTYSWDFNKFAISKIKVEWQEYTHWSAMLTKTWAETWLIVLALTMAWILSFWFRRLVSIKIKS